MSNHYARARAPAEARRISAYLDEANISPENPLTTAVLVAAIWPGEDNEDAKWVRRNISSIAEHLTSYHTRGAPFTYFGRTCRAYFWHTPNWAPEPEAANELAARIEAMIEQCNRIEEKLDQLETRMVSLHQELVYRLNQEIG